MSQKEVIFSPNAEREIKKLSSNHQEFVVSGIESWSSGKTKPEVEKIKSQPDFYRLRLGNFRVIYYPLGAERVLLLLIRDRKNAYQNLGDLPAKLKSAIMRVGLR